MAESPYTASSIGRVSNLPLYAATFITVAAAGRQVREVVDTPVVYDDVLGYTVTLAPNGSISGTVTDGSFPLNRAVVRLYLRKTGQLLQQQLTNAAGQFTFIGLNTGKTNQYFAIAFDPDGAPLVNALIFDYLTPV